MSSTTAPSSTLDQGHPAEARTLSVREAMSREHGRLDRLEETALAAREAHRYDAAQDLFAAFAQGLRRHIEVEEQIVLQEFEARSGISGEGSVSNVMRAEHRAISTMIEAIEGEIGDPQAPVELTWAKLRSLLHDHHVKEDHLLYPALDRLLSPAEGEAIVARAQAWNRG
jgi:hemerythrin-like domain-containing protein